MNCDATYAGKFYLNFKVHKAHTNIPPERAIVSQSGSVTSNIGKYVDFHIQETSKQHDSYLEDTPDFIRRIEKINNSRILPDNAIIVTWDVMGLFTIIPQEEGLECTRNALNKRNKPDVPTEFLMRLLEVVLKDSIFQFSDKFYKQNVGTSMGSNPAPSFANNFMAKIDKNIKELVENMKVKENIDMEELLRFLDDLFSVFTGTTKQLHTLWNQMNKIHPSVEFTMQHTTPGKENPDDHCECEKVNSVPFLDTSCSIKKGKIILDLYRKPTDKKTHIYFPIHAIHTVILKIYHTVWHLELREFVQRNIQEIRDIMS